MVDHILAAQPANEMALVAKARMQLSDAATADALKTIQKATAAPNAGVDAFYWQGVVLSQLGQLEEAVAALTEGLRRNPLARPVQVQLARLQIALGDWAKAREYATAALATEPRAVEPRLVLVNALTAQREFGAAERELAPLLAMQPPPVAALVQLGRIKTLQGDAVAARRALADAARLDPGSLDPVVELVRLDLTARDQAAARSRLQAYLASNSKNTSAMVSLAGLQLTAGDRQAGEALLRKAIDADPSSIAAYSMLGHLYLSEGKGEQALREFQTITARRPANLGAQTMIGITLEALGRTAEATKHYEGLVHSASGAAVAANNLAWLYAESGNNLDMALQLAQDAKRALPDSPEVDDTLGYVYLRKNLPPLALRPLRTAAEKLPDNPVVRWHFAQALAETGDKAGAIAQIEAALKLDANFGGAAAAKTKLQELRSGATPGS